MSLSPFENLEMAGFETYAWPRIGGAGQVEVVQSTLGSGGVHAELRSSDRPSIEAYDPGSPYADERGMVAAPDVDPIKEVTELISAEASLKANAIVINAAGRMFDALIDAMDGDRHRPRRWPTTF